MNRDSRRRFQYFSVFFSDNDSAAGRNNHIGCSSIFLQETGFPAPEAGFTFRLENVRNRDSAALFQLSVEIDEFRPH